MTAAASMTERLGMSVRMIGSLRIRTRDRDLDAYSLGGPKPRQLLEILLLHRGTAVSRNEIAELLWNGDPPGHPEATLESYISVLRRHIQPGQRRTGPLRAPAAGYLIEPGLVDVDLDRFEALIRAAGPASPSQAYGLLCRALELTGEPLLADEMHQDWAETERSRHTLRVTETRIRASETALAIGRPEEAINWAQLALQTEQVTERGWIALILALEQAGRTAEALQAYERYRRVLSRDLGCLPGPGLRAMRNRLLSATQDGHAELSEAAAALAYLYEHRPDTDRTPAEPADPRALSAAADALAGYVHKALHQHL
jgi:SARP family transcriptional regulator, regulator of embCAB operon